MNGILIINKPQNMTSHDVISIMRRKTGIKRIGHSGTLDPMATGVLPIFIGKATRIIQFSSDEESKIAKLYRCKIRFGCTSDTQDIWGEVRYVEDFVMPEMEEVSQVVNTFLGSSFQVPPAYSAIKIDGRKMYEYARKGVDIPQEKIKLREVYINSITINNYDLENNEIEFDVESSKGLYVRTLCADIGENLGCGAVMSELTRLRSDCFDIKDCYSVDELRESAELPSLLPVDYPLNYMYRVDLSTYDYVSFANGIKIHDFNESYTQFDSLKANGKYIRIYHEERFAGIGEMQNNSLKPYKVFHE